MIGQESRERFLVEEVGDELVIYDRDRHRAHHLNRTAALVWRRWSKSATVAELATTLERELKIPPDPELVRFALDGLERAHLLGETVDRPMHGAISRRELVQRLGVAAGLMPLVTSIVVPTPARAASGKSQGPATPSAGSKPRGGKKNGKPKNKRSGSRGLGDPPLGRSPTP